MFVCEPSKFQVSCSKFHAPSFKFQPIMPCNENPVFVFLFWELRSISPNFLCL
jgi:hypothetical protein